MTRATVLQEVRQMRFEELYERRQRRELTMAEAAEMLGVTERTFRRWGDRYEAEGAAGLADRRLGCASARAVPTDEMLQMVTLYETRYTGWTVKHFHEHWQAEHGGTRSYTWTKNRLQAAGHVSRAPRRGAHRKKRPRKPLPGMMLHQDGSTHEWVPGCQWDLIVTMDDASSEIYSAFFVEEEGTMSSFRGLREVIEAQGLFSSLYADRGTHYWYTEQAGGKVDKTRLTQVHRVSGHAIIPRCGHRNLPTLYQKEEEMGLDETRATTIMQPQAHHTEEVCMVDQERWAEIRRLRQEERVSVSEIARRLDLDRKTVRRSLRQPIWQPYRRALGTETVLTAHADFVRGRAPEVQYSARILYQELRANRGYTGSYETVKRFVAPLREVQLQADRALVRFETPPGQQSQIDWGQATVSFRTGAMLVHVFVLTLGFSRRSFYYACADERLAQFLEAHERAFAHFGGHTREHLYDRPRTVCYPDDTGRRVWNPTFKAFADYWGFEPRVCRPYRAQTKGKVESGVKYLKRNFLPGRIFVDLVDFQTQLDEWTATIADRRIHGTTHEEPLTRFGREHNHLVPLAGQPTFHHEARLSRIVAEDYLVSLATNRYSVPCRFIGQRVEVQQRGDTVHIFHRDQEIATHPVLSGPHQFRILPEHGPGAIARTTRQRRSTIRRVGSVTPMVPEVEVRDLACYEQLCGGTAAREGHL